MNSFEDMVIQDTEEKAPESSHEHNYTRVTDYQVDDTRAINYQVDDGVECSTCGMLWVPPQGPLSPITVRSVSGTVGAITWDGGATLTIIYDDNPPLSQSMNEKVADVKFQELPDGNLLQLVIIRRSRRKANR